MFTKGPYKIGKNSKFSVESLNGQNICSTGGFNDTSRDPEQLLNEQVSNARLIAAS